MTGVVADFSHDNIWVTLGKLLIVFAFLVLNLLAAILLERKIIGRMQNRIGPNRTGPGGALQSLADGVKLAFKEDITPKGADKWLFPLAPAIAAVPCFLSFVVIPMGGPVKIPFTDITTPLQMTDFPVAVLYILAIASIGVYGLVLAGWASGSTYPLLGGVRSSAQVISYELSMGLSLVCVFIMAGSMSTSAIVAAQSGWKWLFWFPPLIVPFIIYVISMVGETNRLPFDLPEAEGELVGGFHTEYSSMKFAMFFLAEYVNMFTVSALATTMFLGGWQGPGDHLLGGWVSLFWFTVKLWLFMFLFIWLRGSLPRLRYDQFMKFGWQRLIPVAIAWIFLLSFFRAATQIFNFPAATPTLIAAALLLIIAAAMYFWPAPPAAPEPIAGEVIDPFAGGHPVPPLPGQQLPPSPRAARRLAANAQSGEQPNAAGTSLTKPSPEVPNA